MICWQPRDPTLDPSLESANYASRTCPHGVDCDRPCERCAYEPDWCELHKVEHFGSCPECDWEYEQEALEAIASAEDDAMRRGQR